MRFGLSDIFVRRCQFATGGLDVLENQSNKLVFKSFFGALRWRGSSRASLNLRMWVDNNNLWCRLLDEPRASVACVSDGRRLR